jgi:hypothetical protein
MRNRRYEFQRGGGVTWTLVYDQTTGRWHVEKRAAGDAVRMSLSEFEKSHFGKRFGPDLEQAVHRAEEDI